MCKTFNAGRKDKVSQPDTKQEQTENTGEIHRGAMKLSLSRLSPHCIKITNPTEYVQQTFCQKTWKQLPVLQFWVSLAALTILSYGNLNEVERNLRGQWSPISKLMKLPQGTYDYAFLSSSCSRPWGTSFRILGMGAKQTSCVILVLKMTRNILLYLQVELQVCYSLSPPFLVAKEQRGRVL